MPAEIRRNIAVSLGGKVEWKIMPKRVQEIDGTEFVKIQPHDKGFIRLASEGIVASVPRNATLCHCEGMKELLRLRNEKQRSDFEAAAPRPEPCGLFDAPPGEEPAKKRARSMLKRAQQRELRQSPELLSMDLPATEEHGEPVTIKVVRPAHPCDDLCIELAPEPIERVIAFIRYMGISSHMLVKKRRYERRLPEEEAACAMEADAAKPAEAEEAEKSDDAEGSSGTRAAKTAAAKSNKSSSSSSSSNP